MGNLYLLWGDERKHSFFPFVAIAGPDWPSMLFTYVGFILLTCLDCFIIKWMHSFSFILGEAQRT